jgi:hypothetical protein
METAMEDRVVVPVTPASEARSSSGIEKVVRAYQLVVVNSLDNGNAALPHRRQNGRREVMIDIEQMDQIGGEQVEYFSYALSTCLIPEDAFREVGHPGQSSSMEIHVRHKELIIGSRGVSWMSHAEELNMMAVFLE